MAMRQCRECKAMVSTEAAACPQCGVKNPTGKKTGKVTIFIAGIFALAIIVGLADGNKTKSSQQVPEKTPEQIAKEKADQEAFDRVVIALKVTKSSLKDPSSVEWASIAADDKADVICIEYRAKNSFNATVMSTISFSDGKPSTDKAMWNKRCAGKRMFDMKKAQYAL